MACYAWILLYALVASNVISLYVINNVLCLYTCMCLWHAMLGLLFYALVESYVISLYVFRTWLLYAHVCGLNMFGCTLICKQDMLCFLYAFFVQSWCYCHVYVYLVAILFCFLSHVFKHCLGIGSHVCVYSVVYIRSKDPPKGLC